MTLELSIVAPVYNEGPIVAELANRCAKAATEAGRSFEIVLVDDCSTDATRTIAAGLSTPGLRFIHLEDNRGQFGATQAGLEGAIGSYVVVLDGDLQDPPEVIGALCERMFTADQDVVFAVKESRVDAGWMKVAAGLYGALQGLGGHRWPRGAGSYCIMDNALAHRVAGIALADVNLAAVVMALGAEVTTLPYQRAGRWDVDSHIGAAGLVKEAVVSLALTGALGRVFGSVAVALGATGAVVGWAGGPWRAAAVLSAVFAMATVALSLWVRRAIATVRKDGNAR